MDTLGAVTSTDTFGVDTSMGSVAVAFNAVQGRRKGRSVYERSVEHSRSAPEISGTASAPHIFLFGGGKGTRFPRPSPAFPLSGPPGRPSSPPLDSLRDCGQNAPRDRSGGSGTGTFWFPHVDMHVF
eukprot:4795571-Pyramimonas_sp.AAC.1